MRRIMGPVAVLACLLMLPSLCTAAAASGVGRLQRDRLEIGRALLEVQSADWPSVLPYYTEDIEYHDPIVDIYGIEMMAEFLGRLLASSPDLVTTIEDEALSGDLYSATWTMAGQFAGSPYTAKGISIMKFRGTSRRVEYQRDYYSENDIMINIPGLDEAAIGFRTFYRCAVDPTFDCPLQSAAQAEPPQLEPGRPPLERLGQGNPFRIRRQRLEIGRALVEIDASNWPSVLPHLAPDYEYHDPIVDIYGPETMAEFLGRLFAGSQDLITTVEEEVLAGDVYTATWTMAGLFNGVPFSAPGMSIVKFRPRSAQAYYSRDYYTEGDIMINIPGLDEVAAAFRTYYRCAVDPTFDCPLPEPARSGGPVAGSSAPSPSDASSPGRAFRLGQNVPNPFNPTTVISFVVPAGGGHVSLRIYDVLGRSVRTLVDGHVQAGAQSVSWSGTDDQGRPVASGTYFYQLSAPSFTEIKKMVLLK